MPKLKGLLLFIPSVLIIIVEFKFLIMDQIGETDNVTLNADQYWALAIPVFIITSLIALLIMWVGYTMIVTKEPIRVTYDGAYSVAAGEVAKQENSNTTDSSAE